MEKEAITGKIKRLKFYICSLRLCRDFGLMTLGTWSLHSVERSFILKVLVRIVLMNSKKNFLCARIFFFSSAILPVPWKWLFEKKCQAFTRTIINCQIKHTWFQGLTENLPDILLSHLNYFLLVMLHPVANAFLSAFVHIILVLLNNISATLIMRHSVGVCFINDLHLRACSFNWFLQHAVSLLQARCPEKCTSALVLCWFAQGGHQPHTRHFTIA